MEINGVAHIQLTISDFEASKRFYGALMGLFEDPDGIRLEVNHVPGKGNLDPSITLPLPRPPVP
jgi:hypothetical protein